jgi:hypothetical protein
MTDDTDDEIKARVASTRAMDDTFVVHVCVNGKVAV